MVSRSDLGTTSCARKLVSDRFLHRIFLSSKNRLFRPTQYDLRSWLAGAKSCVRAGNLPAINQFLTMVIL